MKLSIGDFHFPSKTAATEEIRRILHSYPDRGVLTGADHEMISALIQMHPDADEKIGCGIQRIKVRMIEYGAPGFIITRTDGTITDFSYKRALAGKELNSRQRVIKAMRRAVDDDIWDFRRRTFAKYVETWEPAYPPDPTRNHFDPKNLGVKRVKPHGPVCPLTEVLLTDDKTTHVDHSEPKFVELAEEYANRVGGFDNIKLVDEPGRPWEQLTEPHLTRFRDLHRAKARLRLIHRSANLMREHRSPQLNNGATQQQTENKETKQ